MILLLLLSKMDWVTIISVEQNVPIEHPCTIALSLNESIKHRCELREWSEIFLLVPNSFITYEIVFEQVLALVDLRLRINVRHPVIGFGWWWQEKQR